MGKKNELTEKPSKTEGIGTLIKDNAIDFAKWLQHLDNGTTHFNPHTEEITESIGFSPYDCLIDEVYTIEELYDKWLALSGL